MSNDIPGLMAGLSILRMAPIVAHFSRSGANRLTRIATICLRGNMPERWVYFQLAKLSALAGRQVEEGTPRYFQDSAGEVAALACLPSFDFTGSRMDDVGSLSLEFWAACDDLLSASGLDGGLPELNFDSSLELVESKLLDRDRAALESARNPILEYTAMCNAVVNDYPRRRSLASLVAQAGRWENP